MDFIPEGKYSMEKDLLPKIVELQEQVYGHHTEEFLKDMGTPERMKQIEEMMKSGKI